MAASQKSLGDTASSNIRKKANDDSFTCECCVTDQGIMATTSIRLAAKHERETYKQTIKTFFIESTLSLLNAKVDIGNPVKWQVFTRYSIPQVSCLSLTWVQLSIRRLIL
jgi:hypothetical protein